jgi:hypothetical protein
MTKAVAPGQIPATIALRCPGCKKTQDVPRCLSDPDRAAVVEIICTSCDDGDRHFPSFLDASGADVPWHEGRAA